LQDLLSHGEFQRFQIQVFHRLTTEEAFNPGTTSVARSSAKRFFFSLAARERFPIPHLAEQICSLTTMSSRTSSGTMVLSDLCFGTFHGGALRNEPG